MRTKISRKAGLNRLEDFIGQARHGKTVGVQSQLRVEKIIRQDEDDAAPAGRVDGFLFVADFLCTLDNETYTVSKVYSLSYLTPDSADLQVDRHIANARLRMDYSRLQEAGIDVQERYFQEAECG